MRCNFANLIEIFISTVYTNYFRSMPCILKRHTFSPYSQIKSSSEHMNSWPRNQFISSEAYFFFTNFTHQIRAILIVLFYFKKFNFWCTNNNNKVMMNKKYQSYNIYVLYCFIFRQTLKGTKLKLRHEILDRK